MAVLVLYQLFDYYLDELCSSVIAPLCVHLFVIISVYLRNCVLWSMAAMVLTSLIIVILIEQGHTLKIWSP